MKAVETQYYNENLYNYLSKRDAPRISIITPSFNQGGFIEETISSVLNQNYPNLEYIIIDGKSNDNTIEILKKYSDRITYWVSEKDNGQAHAINKGLKKCTGDIIGWLNSDDYLEPHSLFVLAKAFSMITGPAIISGAFKSIKNNKIVWKPSVSNKINPVKVTLKEQDLLRCWKNTLPQPSTYWNKEAFEINEELDTSFDFAMDLEYWLRARKNKIPIYRISVIISTFRYHNNSKTSSQQEKLSHDLNRLSFAYIKNPLQRTPYKIEKYIWLKSINIMREAIERTKVNKSQSLGIFIRSIINFPFIIFIKPRYFGSYIYHLIFGWNPDSLKA